MSGAHASFILAAYGVSVALVAATVAYIALRHRALRRSLKRFGEAGAREG